MNSSIMSRTMISMTTTSVQPTNSGPSKTIGTETSGQNNGSLSADEMIEMLKNLAAVNEKLYKWEQSLKKLETYPNNDINKSLMKDIIDFIDNDKSSTQDKAIYLYGQLAHKCHQQKNFMGAAKAYEKAATLRFDSPNVLDNRNSNDTKTTIQYLESAIVNYDAIHKYRHAGTLHYRCSRILRLTNASPEEVAKHYCQALEYFTMRNHEVKHRKRIDGLKISCYSSKNNYRQKRDCNQSCCRDIDYYVASATKYSRFSNEDSKGSTDNEDFFTAGQSNSKAQDIFSMDPDMNIMGHNNIEHSQKESIISITQHNHNNQMKAQNRCIEDRIDSAKKLVKKLSKFCPYYEVSVNGDDAGRVYCKICERHLGAVSSTLKNHVNTQEHKQAVEDSINGQSSGQITVQNIRQNIGQNSGVTNNESNNSSIGRININRPISGVITNPQSCARANPIQVPVAINGVSVQNSTNSSFDFETFDIQWVPGFQSPNTMDYCMANVADAQNNVTNHLNVGHIQSKTITNL